MLSGPAPTNSLILLRRRLHSKRCIGGIRADLPQPRPIASRTQFARLPDSGNYRRRIVIAGAAGRDFHNFNVVYRNDPTVEVVAFTAAQIPGIAGRRYPRSLAGDHYPDGIEIVPRRESEWLCAVHHVDQIVFAYSDVPHDHVMHVASRALATGADFVLLGPNETMLKSKLPVIAVTAVRTGCGKSAIAELASASRARSGKARCGAAPSHAVWRSYSRRHAALSVAVRSGDPPLHDRRARGIRTTHPRGQYRIRRHPLRGDLAVGRAGGTDHYLGWRQ